MVQNIFMKLSSLAKNEVMIFGEMCVLSLIYSYVAVSMFCAVRCVIIICFFLSFSNYSTYVFQYSFYVCFLVLCLFSILCTLCFCIVSSFVYSCLSDIFVQVHRPLLTGGNTIHSFIQYSV